MTNKPMLPCPFCGSDPFPLEWPEGGDTGEVRCLNLGCPIDDVFIPIEQWNRPRVKVDEIRQGKPAAQHQGEPVAFQIRSRTDRDVSGWTDWRECSSFERAIHSGELGKYNRFGIMREIRALYAEQQSPVAVVMPKVLRNTIQNTLRHYRMGTLSDGEGGGYPLINAMSADGQTVSGGIEECEYLADSIFSACIAEVARLNGVKP